MFQFQTQKNKLLIKLLIRTTIATLTLFTQAVGAIRQPLTVGIYHPALKRVEKQIKKEQETGIVSTQALNLAPAVRAFAHGIDLSLIQPVKMANALSHQDFERIIPLYDSSLNSDNLAQKVFDHSLQSYLDSEAVRNSPLGRAADRVERQLSTQVEWTGPTASHHEVKMFVRAANARAIVEYNGIAKAQVSYSLAQAEINIELSEKVFNPNTEVVLSHQKNSAASLDSVNLRWNF